MIQFFVVLAITAYLHASAHSADKIRISMTGFASQFMTFPLAQKRGFLKEEGIEGHAARRGSGRFAGFLLRTSPSELSSTQATNSVHSLPPCGGGLGRGVVR